MEEERTGPEERELREDETAEAERARVRSGLEPGSGANDEPAAGSGLNRGGYAPREHDE